LIGIIISYNKNIDIDYIQFIFLLSNYTKYLSGTLSSRNYFIFSYFIFFKVPFGLETSIAIASSQFLLSSFVVRYSKFCLQVAS
jgi:hypothetical protein